MPWINGQSGGTRIANGGGLVVVNADGSVSVTPAGGTGVLLGVAPPATANQGLLSLGNGPYDGVSAGHFVGSANGTLMAGNMASGSTADLLRLQVGGSNRLLLDASGNLSLFGSTSVTANNLTSSGNITCGATFFLATNGIQMTGGSIRFANNSGTSTAKIDGGNAASVRLAAIGAPLQTGDLIQAQDSALHPQFGVANAGSGAAPIWALRVRATANAESMAQLHTLGAYTGRSVLYIDDAGATIGWAPLYA